MVLLLLIIVFLSSFQSAFCARGFIRASGTKFVDADCKEYVVNGWNSWEMIEGAIGLSPVSLEWMMDKAVEVNMNTFRAFGHGHHPDVMQMQYSPGSYNEDALRGLDIVLALAADRDLRVVLTFADNWKDVDSKKNYMMWSGYGGWGDEFYYSDLPKQYFKDHMAYIVNRVNSVNGRTYKDDPTIFAWNLINEPRSDNGWCDQGCMNMIQGWIDEMSGFLKSVDPNHMITVGEEGFYGWDSGREWVNPDAWNGDYGSWAMKSGQNFVNNHAGSNIDYAGIHIWVDNWAIYYEPHSFFQQWIQEHANDARSLNKPLVIEEFGKQAWNDAEMSWVRDPYFYMAYQATIDSLKNDDVIRGIMWWEWEGNEQAWMEEYDVKTYQTTWYEQIVPKSQEIADIMYSKPTVSGCVPGEFRSYDSQAE
eukprot:TRINITY_DN447_c0_g1_i1.p1 TRINITY_DN447_c0_g1~~TRINITY_DN447_c0_g1_i1.p1  ORF type:complete len:420 (-),score=78.55 TRINITY_DN447_c0_g1_i1:1613-2872(-)